MWLLPREPPASPGGGSRSGEVGAVEITAATTAYCAVLRGTSLPVLSVAPPQGQGQRLPSWGAVSAPQGLKDVLRPNAGVKLTFFDLITRPTAIGCGSRAEGGIPRSGF